MFSDDRGLAAMAMMAKAWASRLALGLVRSRRRCHRDHESMPGLSGGLLALAAAAAMSVPTCTVAGDEEEEGDRERRAQCRPPWVHEEGATRAECWVRQPSPHEVDGSELEGPSSPFDPRRARVYEVRLVPGDSGGASSPAGMLAGVAGGARPATPLLHNTVVVLPRLLTEAECALIVRNAERIEAASEAAGVRAERWMLYERFDPECRAVIDRALGGTLAFLETRLPDVARAVLSDGSEPAPSSSRGMPMAYYWDDPVVIKYTAGNKLAPHQDMRELTAVFPLNPCGLSLEGFPGFEGGGTRFWLEGTGPDHAKSSDGVSLTPPPGSGVLFNGEITHSGNVVRTGSRFLLMTSINVGWEHVSVQPRGSCSCFVRHCAPTHELRGLGAFDSPPKTPPHTGRPWCAQLA